MRGRPDPILRTLYRLLDVLQIQGAPFAGALISGIGIIVIGLWFWREAAVVAYGTGASHPNLAIYSVRCSAVAGIAAAQAVLLTVVVGRMYRPTVFDELLRRVAGLICAVSLAAAVTLALLAK